MTWIRNEEGGVVGGGGWGGGVEKKRGIKVELRNRGNKLKVSGTLKQADCLMCCKGQTG